MPASLTFDGLEALRAALQALPDDLAKEAGTLVNVHAQAAAGAMRRKYPRITGNLQNGVVVETSDAGRFGRKAVVTNKAPHALIYEYGTEARHYYTKTGIRKAVGRMPAGRVFVPTMLQERQRLFDDIVQLILRAGMQVRRAA